MACLSGYTPESGVEGWEFEWRGLLKQWTFSSVAALGRVSFPGASLPSFNHKQHILQVHQEVILVDSVPITKITQRTVSCQARQKTFQQ